jgi:hypothetical protein
MCGEVSGWSCLSNARVTGATRALRPATGVEACVSCPHSMQAAPTSDA